MSRLVIVSNRVSVPRGRGSRAGGLEVALLEALRQHGGIWFGWSGKVAEATAACAAVATHAGVTYATVDLGKADHENYYTGFANSTLWPLFHFRLGLIDYKRRELEGYRAVNAHFARLLAPMLHPEDVVWVHDYHLIPLAAELRAAGVRNRIGFFLHTPLPPTDVLRALPHHADLVRALCAYDLVGFQTDIDAGAFRDYLRRQAGARIEPSGVIEAFGRRFRAGAFPIGIEPDAFARIAERSAGEADTQRLVRGLSGRALMIGVDRLDYSKGIPNRFEAVRTLLMTHPEHKRRFTFLQIAPLSRSEVREYRSLRRQIDETSGRVNGAFSEFDWTPIRYVSRASPRNALAGFYRAARVGLVTPFRDGMNLVAKEYVAAQPSDDPGALVLSEFAGAARELSAALLVNPNDVDAMAEAMHKALTMPLEERRARWLEMMAALRRNTLTSWRETFLDALADAPAFREYAVAGSW